MGNRRRLAGNPGDGAFVSRDRPPPPGADVLATTINGRSNSSRCRRSLSSRVTFSGTLQRNVSVSPNHKHSPDAHNEQRPRACAHSTPSGARGSPISAAYEVGASQVARLASPIKSRSRIAVAAPPLACHRSEFDAPEKGPSTEYAQNQSRV